jgi:tRNA-dihydrouridine synthase
MLGRAAFHAPWQLADADRLLFGAANPGHSRREVVAAYVHYASETWARHTREYTVDAAAALEAAGLRPLPAAVEHRVSARLKKLRERLYQPLLHLFAGTSAGTDFRRRLVRAFHRHTALSKAAEQALRAVPPAEADARPPLTAGDTAAWQEDAEAIMARVQHTDRHLATLFHNTDEK